PHSIVIIGGGTVGVEFSTLYNALGCKVYLIETLPHILATEDREISLLITELMSKQGIEIITEGQVKAIQKDNKMFKVKYIKENREADLQVEMVLNATGRRPNTENIGLETVHIGVDKKGYIQVDQYLKTTCDSIYAAGDVIGLPLLAYTAFEEGKIAAENALGGTNTLNLKNIPRCVFSHPEIAAVGLTEQQAVEQGLDIKVGKFPFAFNGRALSMAETAGMVKVIVEKELHQIIGVHIIGPKATEIISAAVYAVKGEFTCQEMADYILPHPTLSECLKEAALDCWGIAIHK
ncbi:MAG: FAD-dependent oxidoreductase, partial [Dysgonamonadaceae bacterium]|nr:FAD-dependent oxidoreductase [Dysgonamonadaceae bacterium]